MFLLLVVASTFLVQSATLQDFAGSWTAELKGQPLARLDLTIRNGELQGQLGLAGMHVDAEGNVDTVIPEAGHIAPIFGATVHDGVLSFSAKDEDDTDRFEVRLVDGHATLTLLLTAAFKEELARDGIAAPRPITLTRVSP